MTAYGPVPTPAEVGARCSAVLDRVGEAVVGQRPRLALVLAVLLASGNVLLEDLPGTGKTLVARSFAQALGLDFRRVQFTPDLLPADVTGSSTYDQREGTFTFRPGPVFTQLLLADEVNRTPPRTQAALLEAMQERQVTVEGTTYALEPPFCVLATANPIEFEGTYPLPEAQLDRFLLRVSFGTLTADQEWEVLARRVARGQEAQTLEPVTDAAGLLAMTAAVERVAVEESVGRYAVDLVAATRAHPQVLVGASTRGSLALVLAARALAVLSGRGYVTPDDVQAVAVAALGHRLVLRPETFLQEVTGDDVVRGLLGQVPVPATEAAPAFPRAVTGPRARAAAVLAVLLVLAVAAGRPDLVGLAAPFAVGGLLLPRAPRVRAHLAVDRDTSREGGAVHALVTLSSDGPADVVHVAVPGVPVRLVALAQGRPRTLRVPLPTPRWGRQRVGPVTATPYGPGLDVPGAEAGTDAATVRVFPVPEVLRVSDAALPSRLRTGVHRSRVPGPGVEPVAVRPYAPGDRLRQVDWRATSRTGALHVRATSTDRATDVVVLLDALQDPGPVGGTVLDTAVRAATALVEHYLGLGDTVELVQFGGRLRTLRAGTGRGQLARAREWLLDVRLPLNAVIAEHSALWVPSAASARALVVVLTPLLDPRATLLLASLRQRGATVVAVDVLPAGAVPAAPADPLSTPALSRRLWLLERQAQRERLAELGLPVVPWTGEGTLDAVLGPLVRAAQAPRARAR